MDSRIGYDTDFYAWTQEQARLLRELASARTNLPLDCEHLAEEIEDMGKSDHRAINTALARIVEHLLKLEYSQVSDPRSGWRRTVREQRDQANDLLETSPSLNGKIDLDRAYARGRDYAADGLKQDRIPPGTLPAERDYTLDQILDRDWLPANRHGLED